MVPRNRKTVDLPAKLEAEIQERADELGITVSEFIRRAANRMLAQESYRDRGFTVGAWTEDEDGKVLRAYESRD